jgi:hypothetical protein
MRMVVEQWVEWRLAGETEVLGENLPQRHFVHHKSHMTRPGRTPDRGGGKPATNRLSYGAAQVFMVSELLFLLSMKYESDKMGTGVHTKPAVR